MTKELSDFLKLNQDDLRDNNISAILGKCPRNLKNELLTVLNKLNQTSPALTDIQELDPEQWVASWGFGYMGSFSVNDISVSQLKEFTDEIKPFSVVLQGRTGAIKVQRYSGHYYRYDDLKKSEQYNRLEKERKAQINKINKQKRDSAKNSSKEIKKEILEVIPDAIFEERSDRGFLTVIAETPSRPRSYLYIDICYESDPVSYSLAYRNNEDNTSKVTRDIEYWEFMEILPEYLEEWKKDFNA
jgi:hypothetical protein